MNRKDQPATRIEVRISCAGPLIAEPEAEEVDDGRAAFLPRTYTRNFFSLWGYFTLGFLNYLFSEYYELLIYSSSWC